MTFKALSSPHKFYLLIFILFFHLTAFGQNKLIGGFVTIDELNAPGVGGVRISLKGTDTETLSDNDGEYRIEVPGEGAVLIFSYPGMITKEITVGETRRIDVDLKKFPSEKMQDVFATRIGIVVSDSASDAVKNVAEVLRERLQMNSAVGVSVSSVPDAAAGLNIYIGAIHENHLLDSLYDRHHLLLPGRGKYAAEGFAARLVTIRNAPAIIAAGADNRGVLYAAGAILRQIKAKGTGIIISTFDISSAPAYRFRGANASQGGTMRKYTKARAWTTDEWKRAILDLALAGANCFYAEWGGGPRYEFLKSFDLMTIAGIRPNQYRGDIPEEWKSGGLAAWEWGGNNWVCPSIPEAREALLKQWGQRLETLADHDILRFYGGDPGGCRDDRCKPWGKTFTLLSKDIAEIALKKHPDLTVLIANQDMTNEGDTTIFDYLAESPQPWLYGIAYGPGSNAMSWYFRHELRDDLFEYPGYGWLNRYLAEILNSIPKNQKIVHYSDITHWIMSQYNVPNPERNIAKSYGRRTWHARPRALWQISQAIMPFSQGDIIYTEGYHDHFNQYLWQRLLWDPHQTAEDVTMEYCKLNFGEEAAAFMADAIFQLEKNLVAPLATNKGIDRYYALVREAGTRMPANMMENNHLWRLFMQKGALDKYIQLKLQRELFVEQRIRELAQEALRSGDLSAAIDKSLLILEEPAETPVMAAYREEARRLGMESEQLFGVRNVGFVRLDRPLRDIPGLNKLLKKAASAKSDSEKKKLLKAVIETTIKKTDYGRVHW